MSRAQKYISLWRDLRRLFSLSKPYRGRLYAAITFAIFASSVSLIIPLGLRELIDTVFEGGRRALLDQIALGLLVLFVFQTVTSFLGQYLLRWTGERIIADFRQRLYTHLHRLSLQYFANERIGDITSRLTNDVAALRRAATSVLSAFLSRSLSLLGSMGIMIVLNWRLSIAVLAVVPIATLIARYYGQRVREISRRVQDCLADSTAVAEETLSVIQVVKAFARSAYESRRYRESVEALFEAARYNALVSTLLSALVGFTFYLVLAAIFWFGGMEVLSGRLSQGDLVAFIFYTLAIAQGTRVMSQIYTAINNAIGASERVFELLDTKPEIEDAPDASPLPPVRGHVRFAQVSFGYEPGKLVLGDLSFEVHPGQTVALVGPSGAGKTTILRLIQRFIDPSGGQVLIDDHDLRTVQVQSLRRQVAVVSQDIQLFGTSIRENIRYGRLSASDEEIERASRAANAHAFILELREGYDTLVGERGAKLSGGQRQRIAIARALLSDARILLLDEATSSLDSASEALVQDALKRLMEGRTTFIVAHRLATVRAVDRIVVIASGRIVQEGTHRALMTQQGLYATLAVYQFSDEEEVG